MLRDEKVTLRAIARDDLPKLRAFYNDLEVELAGGGDPPVPRSYEQMVKEFEREAVALLLDHAFRLGNLGRVWLEVHVENGRPIRS